MLPLAVPLTYNQFFSEFQRPQSVNHKSLACRLKGLENTVRLSDAYSTSLCNTFCTTFIANGLRNFFFFQFPSYFKKQITPRFCEFRKCFVFRGLQKFFSNRCRRRCYQCFCYVIYVHKTTRISVSIGFIISNHYFICSFVVLQMGH